MLAPAPGGLAASRPRRRRTTHLIGGGRWPPRIRRGIRLDLGRKRGSRLPGMPGGWDLPAGLSICASAAPLSLQRAISQRKANRGQHLRHYANVACTISSSIVMRWSSRTIVAIPSALLTRFPEPEMLLHLTARTGRPASGDSEDAGSGRKRVHGSGRDWISANDVPQHARRPSHRTRGNA